MVYWTFIPRALFFHDLRSQLPYLPLDTVILMQHPFDETSQLDALTSTSPDCYPPGPSSVMPRARFGFVEIPYLCVVCLISLRKLLVLGPSSEGQVEPSRAALSNAYVLHSCAELASSDYSSSLGPHSRLVPGLMYVRMSITISHISLTGAMSAAHVHKSRSPQGTAHSIVNSHFPNSPPF